MEKQAECAIDAPTTGMRKPSLLTLPIASRDTSGQCAVLPPSSLACGNSSPTNAGQHRQHFLLNTWIKHHRDRSWVHKGFAIILSTDPFTKGFIDIYLWLGATAPTQSILLRHFFACIVAGGR